LIGGLVRNEYMRRFFRQEVGLDPEIDTAVIDVVKTQTGLSLDFIVAGNGVGNTGGLLTPGDFAPVWTSELRRAVEDVSRDAENVGRAAFLSKQLSSEQDAVAQLERDTRDNDFSNYALNALKGRLSRLRQYKKAASELSSGGPVPAAAADLASQFEPLIARLDPIVGRAQQWHRTNQPEITNQEIYDDTGTSLVTAGGRDWDQGDYVSSSLNYTGAAFIAVFDGLGNLFTFGYQSARGQAVQAYRRGDVSYNTMESLSDAAAERAIIMGAVTVGLMIATAGLGSAAAGALGLAQGSLGAAIIGGGIEGATFSFASMTTETLLTSTRSFDDPTAQAIWGQGSHSPGQIAFGTALGFGFGAGARTLGHYHQLNRVYTQEFTVGAYEITVQTGARVPPLAVGTHVTEPNMVFFAREGGAGFYRIVNGEFVPIRVVGRGGVNVTRMAQEIAEAPLMLPSGGGTVPGNALVLAGERLPQIPVTAEGALVLSQRGQQVLAISMEGGGVRVIPLQPAGSALAGRGAAATVPSRLLVGEAGPPALPGAPALAAGGEATIIPVGGTGGLPPFIADEAGNLFALPVLIQSPMLAPAGAAGSRLLPPGPAPVPTGDRVIADFLSALPEEAGALSPEAAGGLIRAHQATLPVPPALPQPLLPVLDPLQSTPLAPFQSPFLQPAPVAPLIESVLPVPARSAHIRTPGPGGTVLGWGGFNITESMQWGSARFIEADRQIMTQLRDRIHQAPDLNPDVFPTLSAGRQRQLIRQVVRDTLEALGVPRDRHPRVTFYNGPAGDYGETIWDFRQHAQTGPTSRRVVPVTRRGEIALNQRNLTVGERAGAAMHEARHYFQTWAAWQESMGRSIHPRAQRWGANDPAFPHGVYYQPGQPQYFTQPSETDAESFGRRVIDLLYTGRRWPSR
jgi:hypothetical protein